MAQTGRTRGTAMSPGQRGDAPGGSSGESKTRESTSSDDCLDDDHDDHSRWAAVRWPEVEEVVESIVSRIDMVQRHIERASVDTRDQLGIAQGELKVLSGSPEALAVRETSRRSCSSRRAR